MHNLRRLTLILTLALPSLVACASSDSPTGDESSADENFTAAADASDPQRASLITALKKANRSSLLPTKSVAWVYRPGAMDAVILAQPFPGTEAPGSSEYGNTREMLKTRGFSIVGKNAPFKDCEFTAKNDYLASVKNPTFLSKRMADLNAAMGETIYSAADIKAAKTIEATITHKLVLTKERLAIYIGKQGTTWKILGLDAAEYSCDA